MKCFLSISNFLEEISRLSHSLIVLCFFALIAGGRLSYFSLLFFANGYVFPFLLSFWLLFFSQLFVGLLRQPFCIFVFLFLGDGLNSCLLYNVNEECSQPAMEGRADSDVSPAFIPGTMATLGRPTSAWACRALQRRTSRQSGTSWTGR